MLSTYVVQRHKTGRTHFDLRILQDQSLRNWSLLKEPPCHNGERRLAIEREHFPSELLKQKSVEEEAFGAGRVQPWDEGQVDITESLPGRMALVFRGRIMSGAYELRRMRWYPGNRWILKKIGPAGH